MHQQEKPRSRTEVFLCLVARRASEGLRFFAENNLAEGACAMALTTRFGEPVGPSPPLYQVENNGYSR